MPRPIHRVAGSYRVTFSPEAWRLIGIMPSATFQSLQNTLDHIATVSSRGTAEVLAPLSETLGGLTVVYSLNDTERILTVVNILRAGPEDGGHA
jgi:hypothetical protein